MFIQTYPTNANMDYALYLKGYINCNNDNGADGALVKQDLSEQDQKAYVMLMLHLPEVC